MSVFGRMALVLKKFEIHENVTSGLQVHIVARKSGVVAWFLTLLGIDVTTVFDVYSNRIEFKYGSVNGDICNIIPLSAVSVGSCGYSKPFLLLLLAVISLLAGIVVSFMEEALGWFLLFGFIATLLFIFYSLKKTLTVAIVTHSGVAAGMALKRSVIEGVDLKYDDVLKVIAIVNRNIIQQTAK